MYARRMRAALIGVLLVGCSETGTGTGTGTETGTGAANGAGASMSANDNEPGCWLRTPAGIATSGSARAMRDKTTAADAPSPDDRFKAVAGWPPLPHGTAASAIEATLGAAGVAFERQVMHKTGDVIYKVSWRSMDGTVYVDRSSQRVSQVLFSEMTRPDLAAAEAMLREVEAELGTPQVGCLRVMRDTGKKTWAYHWLNDRASMSLSFAERAGGGGWSVFWQFAGPEPLIF